MRTRDVTNESFRLFSSLRVAVPTPRGKTEVFLLVVETRRTITRRNRVRSARGAGKQQRIQHSNRVSRFYSQNI